LTFELSTFRLQLAPFSWAKTAIGQRAELRSLQLLNRVTDGFTHPSDLAVAPFANRQAENASAISSSFVQ
jgi:hypothetical protein